MAAAARSLQSLLLLLPLMLSTAAPAVSSYETESLDPGLVVMTLPELASGPESLAFDGRGSGPYSGVSDGSVLLWQGRLRGWTEFAYNSKHSDYMLVVTMGDETGRLLRYDRRSRRVTVLQAGLSFPNGVVVSADGTHVMVAHTALGELRRYWVRGAMASTSETFADLPGYPDNVRADGHGGYWVALSRDFAAGAGAPTVAGDPSWAVKARLDTGPVSPAATLHLTTELLGRRLHLMSTTMCRNGSPRRGLLEVPPETTSGESEIRLRPEPGSGEL